MSTQQINCIFYDINLLNQKKYIGEIIDFFIFNTNNDVIIIYDEYDEEGFDYFKDKNCRIMQNKAITYRSIKHNLISLKPDIFIVNAQRLSDTAYVTVAKRLNIKTVMIQHGMYIPFMKRESFYLLKKIDKTFKYLLYSQVIAKALNLNGIQVFQDFYLTFVKGRVYKEVIPYTDKINVDWVLVYGEYWKEYHYSIFGYSLEKQYVLGYHELNKINEIKRKEYESDTFCYIAQTLVEDGRLNRVEMIKFISVLSKIAENKKVYIKLHPRSDKTLFKDKNFILLDKKIPNTEYYLGHYSSLLALVGHLDGEIILYEFEGHEVPYYFKEFSTVTNDINDLIDRISIRYSRKDKTAIIDKYFSNSFNIRKTVDIIEKISNYNEPKTELVK